MKNGELTELEQRRMDILDPARILLYDVYVLLVNAIENKNGKIELDKNTCDIINRMEKELSYQLYCGDVTPKELGT